MKILRTILLVAILIALTTVVLTIMARAETRGGRAEPSGGLIRACIEITSTG